MNGKPTAAISTIRMFEKPVLKLSKLKQVLISRTTVLSALTCISLTLFCYLRVPPSLILLPLRAMALVLRPIFLCPCSYSNELALHIMPVITSRTSIAWLLVTELATAVDDMVVLTAEAKQLLNDTYSTYPEFEYKKRPLPL